MKQASRDAPRLKVRNQAESNSSRMNLMRSVPSNLCPETLYWGNASTLLQEERPLKTGHILSSLLLLTLAAAIGGSTSASNAVTAENFSTINKSDPVAWFNEGCILLNLSKYNESIEAFSKAIELNDSYAEAWNGKGEALRTIGRSSQADTAFAKAQELGYSASEANPSPSKELNQQANVSGQWEGKLYQLDQAFPYSLYLTQTGSDVKGTSRISLGPYYAVMDLSGSLSNGVLSFTETGTREHKDPPGTYFILKTADLHYISAPAQGLNGAWRCHDSPEAPCNYASPGNISLAKESVD
jgi:tetratricopeptide (TPR) repeat protein